MTDSTTTLLALIVLNIGLAAALAAAVTRIPTRRALLRGFVPLFLLACAAEFVLIAQGSVSGPMAGLAALSDAAVIAVAVALLVREGALGRGDVPRRHPVDQAGARPSTPRSNTWILGRRRRRRRHRDHA